MDIQKIMDEARTPGKVTCPECQEELFAPMDKISIGLYGKCSAHVSDSESENLFAMVEKV